MIFEGKILDGVDHFFFGGGGGGGWEGSLLKWYYCTI